MERVKRVNIRSFSAPSSQAAASPNPAPEAPVQPAFTSPLSALDRFGGIDGIMSMMGKFQKMFGMFQQMRPAFQMISSFMSPKAAVQGITNKEFTSKKSSSKPRAGARSAVRRKQTNKSRVH